MARHPMIGVLREELARRPGRGKSLSAVTSGPCATEKKSKLQSLTAWLKKNDRFDQLPLAPLSLTPVGDRGVD